MFQMFHRKCKERIRELEQINEELRQLNGNLRHDVKWWENETEIWKKLYKEELGKEVSVSSNCGLRLTK